MKKTLSFLILALSLGIASMDSDAAKRFGGGSSLGKQRATPTQREATPAPAQAQPAAPTSPAATPAGLPPPRPTFMQRWGGMLAGLGIGALLATMFGAQMGPVVGLLLAGVLAMVVLGFLMKLFTARRGETAPASAFERTEPSYDSSQPRPQFSGIGSRVGPAAANDSSNDPSVVLGGPVEPFLRVAKTSFIRLQAANDAGNLEDIRDYTTPEMYAEIAMQLRDRKGESQKTEVVSVDAAIADAAIEGDYAYASVRFWGLIREAPGANPEPFDEIWHVRRKASDPRDSWVIAGIQQAA
jgi:predicted lipid-binding transport protein (Tim44 family)